MFIRCDCCGVKLLFRDDGVQFGGFYCSPQGAMKSTYCKSAVWGPSLSKEWEMILNISTVACYKAFQVQSTSQ